MAVGVMTVSVSVNTPNGTKDYETAVSISSPVGQFQTVSLGTGATTVTPPAGTTQLLAIVPATTGTVTLKGLTADTGILSISNTTSPRFFALPLATASFVITCTVAITGVEVLYL